MLNLVLTEDSTLKVLYMTQVPYTYLQLDAEIILQVFANSFWVSVENNPSFHETY
jgi:hypothetical protein